MITTRLLLVSFFLLPSSSLAFCPAPRCQKLTTKSSTALEYGHHGDETAKNELQEVVEIEQHRAAVSNVNNKRKGGHAVLDKCSGILEQQIQKMVEPPTKKKNEKHEILDMCSNIFEKKLDDFVEPTKELQWQGPDMVTNLKQDQVRESRNGFFEGDETSKYKLIEQAIESFMTFPPSRRATKTDSFRFTE
jgi:hypothetical protein